MGHRSADGNGAVDSTETNKWMDFLKDNKISHLNWAVNDKQEGASIITPGTSTSGNWPDSRLTASGLLVRSIVRDWPAVTQPDNPPPTPPTQPPRPPSEPSERIVVAPIVDLVL